MSCGKLRDLHLSKKVPKGLGRERQVAELINDQAAGSVAEAHHPLPAASKALAHFKTGKSQCIRDVSTHLNYCTTCGADFGGVTAFDKHRVGKHAFLCTPDRLDGRRCLTTEEMLGLGMYINAQGRWSQPDNGRSERMGLAQEATAAQVGLPG